MKKVNVNLNNKKQMKKLRIMANENKLYKNYEGNLKVFGSEHFEEVAKDNKKVFVKDV